VTCPPFFRCEVLRSYSSPYSRTAGDPDGEIAGLDGDRDYFWRHSAEEKVPRLQRIGVRILAVTRGKSAISSFFYDSAPLHHDDPVGEADRSKPMSDDQSGRFGGRTLQGFNQQPVPHGYARLRETEKSERMLGEFKRLHQEEVDDTKDGDEGARRESDSQ
jgi:hypothetical protein